MTKISICGSYIYKRVVIIVFFSFKNVINKYYLMIFIRINNDLKNNKKLLTIKFFVSHFNILNIKLKKDKNY